ncbi:hypothetical protein MDOR_06930 [Mycolicibacterium doricum]|uniref:Uncharacterized protein n=1 Tax=Mycolicibacterium doricum TaxID=126673 RepID=A0A1X1SZQ5_9MYCO|nr:hypothetical protein [Mycolicibacterium doricum]ORV37385.1 hypothetical protein AWC01_16205 [Mycolicibacterium doricum]BBZ06524.1 hypothetical protein MDOR_06930 [Mycolicibacterium doricum]
MGDPTAEQACASARHFGARRKAYNGAVAVGPCKRRRTIEDPVCVNAQTGQPPWSRCSPEVYADGIAGAVDGRSRSPPSPDASAPPGVIFGISYAGTGPFGRPPKGLLAVSEHRRSATHLDS